jgi:putative ABC transport system substrate-binding protein
MVPEMSVKRLELMKELVPGITRVLVLSFLADPIAPIQVKAMEAAAPALGLKLQVENIRTADDLPVAFDAAIRERAQGLLITEESIFSVHRARTNELAARHKLPAIYPFPLPVTDAGGLMAFTVISAPELHRQAAEYIDRLLKGAKVSDLPIQQPRQFELVINLNAAKIGHTIPATLLSRATEVIE